MSLSLASRLLIFCLTSATVVACHRQELRGSDEDDEGGPTTISVARFEMSGSFEEIASGAQAAVAAQGGPSAVRSEGQVRFRNRAGRLTIRQTEENTIRVELVLQMEASVGDQHRWQQAFRAISGLRGIGRRIVNGQPVVE
jgi:hypothetical protein